MIGEIGVSAKAASSLISVAKPVWQWLRGKTVDRQMNADLREVLGVGRASHYGFRAGMLHPTLHRGEVHPDDQAAFCTLAGPTLAQGLVAGWLVLDHVECDPTENIVLVGSPGAGRFVQTRLRLERRFLGRPGLRYVGDTLDLPYRWEEAPVGSRPSVCDTSQTVWEARPNWPMAYSNRGHVFALPLPKFVAREYLLPITSS